MDSQSLLQELRCAINSSDIKKISELHFENSEFLNHPDCYYMRNLLLLETLLNEKEEFIKFVVDHVKCDENHNLENYLENAILEGNEKLTEFLLKCGAKLEADKRKSIIKRVFAEIRKNVLLLLLKYFKKDLIEFKSESGGNLIHQCIIDSIDPEEGGDPSPEYIELLKILVNSGIPVDIKDKSGNTPLTLCFGDYSESYHGLVSILVEKGANVNREDSDGKYPLLRATDIAVESNNMYAIKLLLKSGADINAQDSVNGWTALHMACWAYDDEIVSYLVLKGADINLKSFDGETSLSFLDLDKDPELTRMNNPVMVHVFGDSFVESVKSMVRGFSRLAFQKHFINENDFDLIKGSSTIRKYFEECKAELKQMKVAKFYKSYSYYCVLKMSADINKLANLTKNKEFESELKKNLHKFPCYQKDLQEILDEAVQERDTSKLVDQ